MSHITNPEGAAPASSSIPPLFNARRVRVQHIARAKAEGIPLTMLTAYDALTAPILEAAGVDMLLIGDSLGNVILGHSPPCLSRWRTWNAPRRPLHAQPRAP